MSQTIDIYDSLTTDELETVTNIFLEALSRKRYRERDGFPEPNPHQRIQSQPPVDVFEIVTNIIID